MDWKIYIRAGVSEHAPSSGRWGAWSLLHTQVLQSSLTEVHSDRALWLCSRFLSLFFPLSTGTPLSPSTGTGSQVILLPTLEGEESNPFPTPLQNTSMIKPKTSEKFSTCCRMAVSSVPGAT